MSWEFGIYIAGHCELSMETQLNKHPFPLYERHLTTMFICFPFHGLLSIVQMNFQLTEGLVSIKQHRGYRVHWCFSGQKRKQRWRGESIDDLKGSLTNSWIEWRVVPVSGPWKPEMPLSWLFRSKTTQVGLQTHVSHLRLTVSLRVISCAHPQQCSLESKQLTLEFAQE